MRYDKPEIVELATAVDAIQGEPSKGAAPMESESILVNTIGAYRADE